MPTRGVCENAAMTVSENATAAVRTLPKPSCLVCGGGGALLFHGLRDRLFGAPGVWDLKECTGEDCGLLWLDPTPAPEEIGKLYEEYYTHEDAPRYQSFSRRVLRSLERSYLHRRYGYLADSSGPGARWMGILLSLHPGRRSQADCKVMHLPFHEGGRLLEVGSGNGETLEGLREMGWKVRGLDFDPRAVEHCRGKGLEVDLGDLASQGYPAASFDAVVSSNVIEHVPDPGALLRQCLRILEPGGTLVLQTPNADSFGRRHFREHWRGLEPPRHLHIFNPRSLIRIVEAAGFREARCKSTERGSSLLLDSQMLKKAGAVVRPVPSVRERIKVELAYFLEWLLCRIRPGSGEEIVLQARRPT